MIKKCAIVVALMAALCATTVRPTYAILDKTRFATDVGMAYFAFHHWVLAPYRQGMFAKGSPHRTKSMIKGGAALLFAVTRLRAANDIAHKTRSPLLRALVRPLDAMTGAFSNVGDRLKNGRFDPSDINVLSKDTDAMSRGANSAGMTIKDVRIPVPAG